MKWPSVILDADVFRVVPTVLATFSLTVTRGEQFHTEITASRKHKRGRDFSFASLFIGEKTFCRRSQEASHRVPSSGLGHMPLLWL